MGFVNVPVPEERVQEVYALLAKPRSGNGTAAADEWTREEIARFFRESPPAMKSVLKEISGRVEQDVSTEHVAKATGLTRNQLAGTMGAAGRRVKNRYRKHSFPFKARWSPELRMFVYWMPGAVAEAIWAADGD